MSARIEVSGITETLGALTQLELRVRKVLIFEATRAAMNPHVATVKQAAVAGLTTLNSKARRQMASSIGIKSKNVGKTGKKAISWAIVGPVMGRELTSPRKRRAGTNGQFDYAKMAHWFGGGGVKPHSVGGKGMHPGIPATDIWERVFISQKGAILGRFERDLSRRFGLTVKEIGAKAIKRQARQQKALMKALGK